jgi:hypothetical protein
MNKIKRKFLEGTQNYFKNMSKTYMAEKCKILLLLESGFKHLNGAAKPLKNYFKRRTSERHSVEKILFTDKICYFF